MVRSSLLFDVAHEVKRPGKRSQLLPHHLHIPFNLEPAVQGMGHSPDIVIHWRWERLNKFAPALHWPTQGECIGSLRSDVLRDPGHGPVDKGDHVRGTPELQQHISGEMSAN